jgi:hypothetical protein
VGLLSCVGPIPVVIKAEEYWPGVKELDEGVCSEV